MKRVFHLVRKELVQVFRDPNMIRVILVMPIFQLFVLGYAITLDVKHLKTLVIDRDGSSSSRALVDRFMHDEHFSAKRMGGGVADIEGYLRRGDAALAVVVPEHFGRDIESGGGAEIQILVDGSHSNSAGIGLGYCNRIVYRFMSDRAADNASKAGPLANASIARNLRIIEPATRIWYNPELKSAYFMIPAIITILLTTITMLLTGLAIVKEREAGTLEQLFVTPLRPWQVIAGKTIPFAMLGFAELAIATTIGFLWFRIPVVGSIPTLALFAFCFVLTTLGLGIFISTIAATQQQAMYVSWFFMQIFILLSGFFYPIANMPHWIQTFTLINPLRHFLAVNRELLLKGAGLADLWPELRALLVIGVCVFTFATLRFHKRAG